MFGSTIYLKKSVFKQTNREFKNIENYDNGELDKFLTKACKTCSVLALNKKIVYGYGNKKPEIFIIIESPSKVDIINNKLLSGAAGKLMDKIFLAIKRNRKKHVYITSLIKHKHENNRNPLVSEISCCLEHLNKQISILKPQMILMLGNVVPRFLLKKENKIDDLRGEMHVYYNIPTYITYHPISLIKDEKLKLLVWKDFKTIKYFLDNK